jgi:hypothetical protein
LTKSPRQRAIASGVTIVSTIMRFALDALITPSRMSASIATANSSSTPALFRLTPARQARRTDWSRWLRLQDRLANEDPPIGILEPLPHDLLGGQVECVLQIMQICNQTQ